MPDNEPIKGRPLDQRLTRQVLGEMAENIRPFLKEPLVVRLYGGSALLLASNFRLQTFDFDAVANLAIKPGGYLTRQLQQVKEPEIALRVMQMHMDEFGKRHGLGSPEHPWFDTDVRKTLSPLVNHEALVGYVHFEDIPVERTMVKAYVPTLEHITAMKLNAARITEERDKDATDILNLRNIAAAESKNTREMIAEAAKVFPDLLAKRPQLEDDIEKLAATYTAFDLAPEPAAYLGRTGAGPRRLPKWKAFRTSPR